MFKNLTNFSYKRNWKEAIGFYLAYFLLTILLCFVLGAIAELIGIIDNFNQGVKLGNVTVIIVCLILCALLLKEKKLLKNFGYILLFFLSGVLAYSGGALLGLIIPAIITTKQAK